MRSSFILVKRAYGVKAAVFGATLLGFAPICGAAPIEVGVSIAPLVWMVEQIGGAQVRARVLAKPGDSAETFQPSDAQVSDLLRAEIFFRIGLPFESSPTFQALLREKTLEVIDLSEGLELLGHDHGHLANGPHAHGAAEMHAEIHGDPHFWLSPRRMIQVADRMALALAAHDPHHAAVYHRGRDQTQALLRQLDEELGKTLRPYQGHIFLIHHPEWSYFAADYGLHQLAVEQDGQEPTEFELTRLLEAAQSTGLRVVFRPPQLPARGSLALAEALGAEVVELDALDVDLPSTLRRGAAALARSFARQKLPSAAPAQLSQPEPAVPAHAHDPAHDP